MDLKIRQAGDVTILDVSGKITLGEGNVTLRQGITDALTGGSKKLLLNLADVSYVDSAGLGEIVGSYTTVKNAGGELKLINLTKKIKDLLVITKLVTVLDVQDDEAAGLASFQ
jgi:anti-sigma B factor antagonist